MISEAMKNLKNQFNKKEEYKVKEWDDPTMYGKKSMKDLKDDIPGMPSEQEIKNMEYSDNNVEKAFYYQRQRLDEKTEVNTETNFELIAVNVGRMLDKASQKKTEDILKLLFTNGITSKDFKKMGAITKILESLEIIALSDTYEGKEWETISIEAIRMLGENVKK